ncbi:MAG TPA: helix-turn-helix domain-containing protein, partial [Paludibacter sp.]|nr:helix-turn-helix domain-containing protein [Paludibacter sp.]
MLGGKMANFPMFQKKLSIDPSLIGLLDLLITESDTDATAATAAGFPAIGFPNNLRTEENYLILLDICKNSKKIFIIDSSGDTTRLGEIGFRLAKESMAVFIVSLFDAISNRHITLSDYLQTHKPEEFKALTKQAPSFIDILIAQLPENFIHALSDIKEKILPLIFKLDAVTVKHYTDAIRKRVRTTQKVVESMLAELKRSRAASKVDDANSSVEEEADPEILAAAADLAQDPKLLKKRIDVVNKNGVSGERKNIAIFLCTLDSRLLLDQGGIPGQNVIACKISGHQGSGKSYTLMMVLSIYPESAVILITSASERSLYYLDQGIAHKCMVVMEGFQFSSDRGDSELAYTVRVLLSEGMLRRAVTEKDEETGKFVTREIVLNGPTSFITTTIESNLEAQLDDRMFTIHPDESIDQTKRIITNRARQKAGNILKPDDREIRMWKSFHRSLKPISVVIPYAEIISEYLTQRNTLPIAARRAFNKVLNVVQTITCTYQFQRQQDAEGNVIATIADYFMALQIVAEAFRENMGQLPKATGERLAYLSSQGHTTPKALANHFGVSRAAISSWAKKLVEESIVEWVDAAGNSFPNDKALYAAKKAGKAHIQVSGNTINPWSNIGLPMPNDIVSDPAWV